MIYLSINLDIFSFLYKGLRFPLCFLYLFVVCFQMVFKCLTLLPMNIQLTFLKRLLLHYSQAQKYSW